MDSKRPRIEVVVLGAAIDDTDARDALLEEGRSSRQAGRSASNNEDVDIFRERHRVVAMIAQ